MMAPPDSKDKRSVIHLYYSCKFIRCCGFSECCCRLLFCDNTDCGTDALKKRKKRWQVAPTWQHTTSLSLRRTRPWWMTACVSLSTDSFFLYHSGWRWDSGTFWPRWGRGERSTCLGRNLPCLACQRPDTKQISFSLKKLNKTFTE